MISSGQNERETTAARTTAMESNRPWYADVTGYQWLILIIASAGWIFDVYEGQVYNLSRQQLLEEILKLNPASMANFANLAAAVKYYSDILLIPFLLGGAVGGLFFGSLADKWGRKPTMIATILMYSVFSGLTYFAHTISQVTILRFLVAMGIGGEWAVAASLVAEVFPARARTRASGIFHASSVLGTWIATSASLLVGSNWRYAYLVGVVPAFLTVWVMTAVREPERWKKAEAQSTATAAKPGSVGELLGDQRWRGRAILGMLLAAVGLGSYWAVHIAGQQLAQYFALRDHVAAADAAQKAKWAYGYVQTIGGGLGLLAFGPICARIGRKRTFVWMHILAFLIVPVICYVPQNYTQFLILLPVFGFLTLSMHAGYAIYFPELFPTHLRATGAGFCFNVARAVSASMLFFSGWLKALPNMTLPLALTLLSSLFLLGLVVIYFLPETKDQPLPQ
jgi:MFS family permease